VQEVGIAVPKLRGLGEGAAEAAPTAPHATPRAGKQRRSGPERFWARWPVRVVLALCLVISGIVHGSLVPFEVPHGFEMNDVEGEAAIPVDLLAADETSPPPPPPAANPENPPSSDEMEKEAEAKARMAEVLRRDAGSHDASSDARADAVADAGPTWDGALPLDNADAGSGGRRDPEAIVGAASVRADVVLVKLVVNTEVIRRHPVGARIGYLLRGIPQWDEFMNGTDVDLVRDTDWIMIIGPSLINTARDTVLMHYSVPDSVVDRAVGIIAKKYDRGGSFDAGVRGVKASLIHADRAEHVILRPQPHLLAVVPPSVAERNARVLVGARLSEPAPGEAVYLRLLNPHHPMPEIPVSITEMRLRVVPRADAGADVLIEGDTSDAEAASQAADAIRQVVRRHDDAITSLLTHGLLDHVDVGTDGSVVKAHLTATRDQIETLVTLVGDLLGIPPDVPPVPAAPLPPSPSPALKPRQTR
jgi:hypothetical protein